MRSAELHFVFNFKSSFIRDYSFLGSVVVMTFDMLQWMQNPQRSIEMSINKRWFYILISKCIKNKALYVHRSLSTVGA